MTLLSRGYAVAGRFDSSWYHDMAVGVSFTSYFANTDIVKGKYAGLPVWGFKASCIFEFPLWTY